MIEPLPPDLTDYVSAKLASGMFASLEDMTIAALRHYRDTEALDVERLKASIEESRRQIARGECIEIHDKRALKEYFEDVKRRGREALAREQG